MKWWACARTSAFVLVAIVSLAMAASALAATSTWEQTGTTDPATPAGVACPSAALCVAVDAGGNTLTSTSPATRGAGWTVSAIDPGAALTGVSCPSTQLCVAVDGSGAVLTTGDPAAAHPAWQRTVLATHPWAGVSCPAATFCVAVGGQDVAFSSNPAGGASAWTIVSGVDESEDYDCGKYGGGPNCPREPFASVSCPTASVCEAIDAGGLSYVSTDAGEASGWRHDGDLETTGFPDTNVACASRTLCLQDCPLGGGISNPCFGPGSYDDGVVIMSDPSAGTTPRSEVIAPEPLVGLWCEPAGCFAARESGGLLGSPDPGDARAWWQQLVASPSGKERPAPAFAAVACPSRSECVGLTSNGALMIGPPPATLAQVRTVLGANLSHQPRAVGALTLLRRRGYRERWRIPVAGTMTLGWYQAGTGKLVAGVTRSVAVPADPVVRLRLTRAGRRLVRAGGRVRLVVRGTFTPKGQPVLRGTGHAIVVG